MTIAEGIWRTVEQVRPAVQSPVFWCAGWIVYLFLIGMAGQAREAVLSGRSRRGDPGFETHSKIAEADFQMWFRIAFGICVGVEVAVLALWCSSTYFDWAGGAGFGPSPSAAHLWMALLMTLLVHGLVVVRYRRESIHLLMLGRTVHPVLFWTTRQMVANPSAGRMRRA